PVCETSRCLTLAGRAHIAPAARQKPDRRHRLSDAAGRRAVGLFEREAPLRSVHAPVRAAALGDAKSGAGEEENELGGMTMVKSYGTVSRDQQKDMSGLDFVRGLASGALPLNTIAQTLGYDVTEAESGRVVITLVPTDAHLNPAGTVHGGLTAT